ncbi:VOC family protein [Williamsia sterculiae]|uniref:Glyoxalase superfamily enzyme, possibly 3-demethylubiquinone-9 3-methyltransferase n=1 Tax=Williamsia sterculiae TaxID=1344003 RepID=A0A1N7DM00_9NOCA|nr:VOC family protein [Williamsia sterculiae]SIR76882.1 Glyoxalase superfamily enzyme, possibly 3-demethylubiquinone-9 3-methyltransferase [Williamsia sterculiae]
MATITPSLWFDNDLEDAIDFYRSVFPDTTVHQVHRHTEDSPGGEPGSVLAADFELLGARFNAINGGPQFPFTEAVSFRLDCADQDEVDHYWYALLDGGVESQCGWLKDRFGLSWQVVPRRLMELLSDPDRERANRTMQAMLGMRRLVVSELEGAADRV